MKCDINEFVVETVLYKMFNITCFNVFSTDTE